MAMKISSLKVYLDEESAMASGESPDKLAKIKCVSHLQYPSITKKMVRY